MSQNSDPKDPSSDSDDFNVTDPLALGHILMDVYAQAQPLLQDFFEHVDYDIGDASIDPLNIRDAYTEFFTRVMADPQKLVEAQVDFWTKWVDLWSHSTERFLSSSDDEKDNNNKVQDRRFKSPLWQENAIFDFIMKSYLLTTQSVTDLVHDTEGMDKDAKQKVEFYTRQFLDAVAPSNFILTNPEVLKETFDTKGKNLINGLENLVDDLKRGHGELKISTTNYEAFKLGENLATTPGKVVFQNDLIQLIQYEPMTEKVHKRPLLIVPPWINKYYILDLKEENSFIKWMLEQGHTVFVISWVNPDRKMAQKRFEDYMEDGIFAAIDAIEKATGEKSVNAIGYCLGGTLLSITLGYLAAHKKENTIAAATFFTTLIDFEQAGDMKLFIDEAQVRLMDKDMEDRGFLEADYLRKTFSMLRSNDMIWSFVVNNYLMGKEPFPFDLLYWNDDATNMPAAMHSFYLRKLYQSNLLKEPGGVTMNSTPINIRDIQTPSYFLSAKEDHIAPWVATYAGAKLFSGPVHFTLAASGHVAGVVNHPDKNKYCYWTADKLEETPEGWFNKSKSTDGSWWPHYKKWIKQYAGAKVPARKPGDGKLKVIEDAPGTYVKMEAPES